jgi:plasmid stabilization system protein ParE
VRLLLRPAAAADVEAAYRWYEHQRVGLGEEFLAAVRRTLKTITAHPAGCPVIHRHTRRALVRRFPYAVFYQLVGEQVVVVACMHGRRSPRRWRRRR